MIYYKHLDGRSAREFANTQQLYTVYVDIKARADLQATSSLYWHRSAGREYLYQRTRGNIRRSLGPKSSATEARFAAFEANATFESDRLASLAPALKQQAAICRALGLGRVSPKTGQIIHRLAALPDLRWRVIGSDALYLYEALGGVRFHESCVSSRDGGAIRLPTVAVTCADTTTLMRALKGIKFFEQLDICGNPIFTHDDVNIALIQETQDSLATHRKQSNSRRAYAAYLQALMDAPTVSGIALDRRGRAVPLTCPDPRYYAAHLLWLSAQMEDGEVISHQAMALASMVLGELSYLPWDAEFLQTLSPAVAGHLKDVIGSLHLVHRS